MTTLNLNSRELRSRRFALLVRGLGGREDVALGLLTYLWLRCLEDKTATFSPAERLTFVVCPLELVDKALNSLIAAGYLVREAESYRCLDVEPWIARAHVRLARARRAGEQSVRARAKKKAAQKRAAREVARAAPPETTLEKRTEQALTAATRACWEAYSAKYRALFGTLPIRNVKVNALIKQFCKRVPMSDAPAVLTFFVGHGHTYYAQRMYPLDLAVKDAESLYTQWQTGHMITRVTMDQYNERQKLRATLEEGVSF